MDFTPLRPRRRSGENIVPMINVVFLLLIFFLMTAQITAPVPFEVTPPASASETAAAGPATLNVSADGALFFDGMSGDAVWAALAELSETTALLIRADQHFAATELTRLLARLTAIGLRDISLVTEGM